MKRTLASLFNAEESVTTDVAYVVLLILAFLFAIFNVFSEAVSNYIIMALAIAGVIPVGWSALKALKNKKITVDLLASVALIFAYLAQEWRSAAFINLMLASARIFDGLTQQRSKQIIQSLLKLRPATIKVQVDSKIVERPVSDLRIGDLMVVQTGDRIAADGVVKSGTASINESTLTGESLPVQKQVGDQVFSSTLNESGSLLVEATKVGDDTTLAQIIKLVSQATREKSKAERIGDRFAAWYISLTFGAAIILYLIFRDVRLVLALLLVVCADDIAVAVPLAFSVGITKAAQRGIIVKGGHIIELLHKVTTIVCDKTGTLTTGVPTVEEIVLAPGMDETRALQMLSAAEINSNHPYARAIVSHIQNKGISVSAPDRVQEFPGKGILASTSKGEVIAGKLQFLSDQKVKLNEKMASQAVEHYEGKTSIHLAIDGQYAGYVILTDQIRSDAKDAIDQSLKLGVKRWIMLTGDQAPVAKRVSEALGIQEYHANISPEEKLQMIKKLKSEDGTIAMIGDGVNDAAALALADVGIAMGVIGSSTAIESADAALMRDELKRIPELLRLGDFTMNIVRQNFVLWGVTNALGLILVFGHIIGPEGAAAYNFVTDLITIGNTLRLLNSKLA